jgi:hypothetical protein
MKRGPGKRWGETNRMERFLPGECLGDLAERCFGLRFPFLNLLNLFYGWVRH